jgi:hypothetical protein
MHSSPPLVNRHDFDQFSCTGCDRWFSSKHRLEGHHSRCKAYRVRVLALREQKEAHQRFEDRLQRERNTLHNEYATYIAELKADIVLLQSQLQKVLHENEHCLQCLEELHEYRRREAAFERLLSGDPSDLFTPAEPLPQPQKDCTPDIPVIPDIPVFASDMTIQDFFSEQ